MRADGPRTKRDRVHLRRPRDHRDLGWTHLVGDATGGELDPRRPDVCGSTLGDPLLEERIAASLLTRREDHPGVNALGPALERRRAAIQRPHDSVPDGDVVLDDVELGDRRCPVGRREDDPIGTRDPHLPATGVDRRGVARGHRHVLHEVVRRARPTAFRRRRAPIRVRIAPINVSTATGNTSCGVPAAHHTVSKRRRDASISVSSSVSWPSGGIPPIANPVAARAWSAFAARSPSRVASTRRSPAHSTITGVPSRRNTSDFTI